MTWFKTISKTNPDSFKGKIYLLLFEKVLLGALIAGAFVIYDGHRETDSQKFQISMVQLTERLEQGKAESEQTLEKVRLLAELIPLLRDKNADPLSRAYLLRSAVQIGVIDPDGAVDLASSLFIDELTQEQFVRVMSVVIPGGIPAIARQGVRLSLEWKKYNKDAFDPNSTFDPVGGRENIPENIRNIIGEGRAWSTVLRNGLSTLCLTNYAQLEDTGTLANHLYGLFVLMNPADEFEQRNLSQQSCRAIRLIGDIGGIIYQDPDSTVRLSKELNSDHSNIENIRLAREIIGILHAYGLPFHIGGALTKSLALILTEDSPDNVSPEVKAAHYWLQFEAGELMTNMADAKPSEQVLIDFVTRFRDDAAKVKSGDHRAIDQLSSKWESGKFLRVAVVSLGKLHTDEATRALQQLGKLNPDIFHAFPFLVEDLAQALKN